MKEWITVTPIQGQGNKNIQVSIEPSEEERTGTIVISTKEKQINVLIKQKGENMTTYEIRAWSGWSDVYEGNEPVIYKNGSSITYQEFINDFNNESFDINNINIYCSYIDDTNNVSIYPIIEINYTKNVGNRILLDIIDNAVIKNIQIDADGTCTVTNY